MRFPCAFAGALLAFAAQPLVAAGFPLVQYDGFEACELGYLDVDDDGFGGAQDVAHRCDPLLPGYVRTGGDCADGDPDIHPDAIELAPDEARRDENCDGVDGDASIAVFVAPDGALDPSCGSRSFPCALASAAAAAAGSGKTQIYLSLGDHQGPLVLASTSPVRGIYGGYAQDFGSRSISSSPRRTRVHGTSAPDDDALAFELSGFAFWIVTDLAFIAPSSASQTATGEGLGSVAIRVRDGASLDLQRSDAVAGDGAAGAPGAPGQPADPLAALPGMHGGQGGTGAEFSTSCNDVDRGDGGGGGFNVCLGGGRLTGAGDGGDGGSMDTQCDCCAFDYDAAPGSPGTPAAFTAGASGLGGLGGSGTGACGPTSDGGDGLVTDGQPGERSLDALVSGMHLQAGNGGAGSTGLNGSGGGGGGGSGGCDSGTDAYGPGGGGGGAGGCAAPVAGLGGKGGGSSMGIVVIAASLAITDVSITAGSGGRGGDGGAGGEGQAGGNGASGGPRTFDVAIPGRGGNGARGGHAGGGAGGNGGHSIGIFHLAGPIFGTASTTVSTPGAAGNGGTGFAQPTTGQTGLPGTSVAVWQCADASAC